MVTIQPLRASARAHDGVNLDAVSPFKADVADRYEIEREIGRGGMAVVYLARDLRHQRRVAIKLLDPDVGAALGVERFLLEIRVTATLQHPNLVPLFDSGEAGGQLFYVMPFVEGESLRARLDREKMLPVVETLRIATIVAGALDYAHRKGVVHRDLKPENILFQDGQPLVADFGIALAVANASGDRLTQTGISLGTPAYMSPEQASGDNTIDARTDVYSLSAITYELLTGEPPHTGPTARAVIARIITDKPRSVRASRDTVPDHVAWAVEQGLAKLPVDRFASVREFADALNSDERFRSVARLAGQKARDGSDGLPARRPVRALRAAPWAIGVAGFVIGSLGLWGMTHRQPSGNTMRFPVIFAENIRLADVPRPLALSPDGRLLAFVGTSDSVSPRVFVRPVNDMQARQLLDTEGAEQLFFSPDGKWIGFYAKRQLKKVAADGGASVVIGDVPGMIGASWGPGDQIVVSSRGRLGVVPAGGGTPRPISSPDTAAGEFRQLWPVVLDDGHTIAYTARKVFVEDSRIGLASLDGGKTSILDLPGTAPLGLVDGRLIYATATGRLKGTDIMAVSLDRALRAVVGTSAPVVVGVGRHVLGSVSASLSTSGALVYQSHEPVRRQVVLSTPRGQSRVLLAEDRPYVHPRFSPRGDRLVVSTIGDGPGADGLYVLDLRSATLTQLKPGSYPEWTPDGKRILFQHRNQPSDQMKDHLWTQPVDLSGSEQALAGSAKAAIVEGVLDRSGNTLVVRVNLPDFSRDLWFRHQSGDTAFRPLVQTPESEFGPRISPDGHWVAYWTGDINARSEVYVTPLPGPGPRYQVSANGGAMPVWSPDGRKLYYVREHQLLAATLSLTGPFSVTRRDTVFDGGFDATVDYHAMFDVAPDGKQFVLLKRLDADPQVVFVHDWKFELRARLSAGQKK